MLEIRNRSRKSHKGLLDVGFSFFVKFDCPKGHFVYLDTGSRQLCCMWHDVDMLTMNKIKILPDISCYVLYLLECIKRILEIVEY